MLFRCLAVLAVIFGLGGEARAAKRIALVIGNANYTELTDLQKTIGDARGYRDALSQLGFTVTYRTNLDFRSTAAEIGGFIDRIEPGDEVAFVFAGHGWSDGQTNYLLPVDSPDSGSEGVLSQLSTPLRNGRTGILDQITARGATLSFSVIDACRDNPFQQTGGTRSAGLARGGLTTDIVPPQGSFVVYSAGTGQTALDRLSNSDTNPYSVFSRVFLPLLTSGVTLERAVSQAQVQVRALAAQIGHSQLPAYYDQTAGDSCLDPRGCDAASLASLSRIGVQSNAPQATAPVAPPATAGLEAVYWGQCLNNSNPAYCDAYLQQFPQGSYARLVEIRRDELAAASAPVPPPPVPAPAQVATLPVDPCRDYPGVRPSNARCVVENGQAVWLSTGPTAAELARQRAEREAAERARREAEAAAQSTASIGPRPSGGEAVREYDKCIGGDARACAQLGFLYRKGLSGLIQNDARAVTLYRQGCDGGNAVGCSNLGVMYEQGLGGLAKDAVRAVALYRQGCDGGVPNGCTGLGYMYDNGFGGLVKDYVRAVALYRQSCDGGDMSSCSNLGNMYETASGVPKDLTRAKAFYKQGCDGGDQQGCNWLQKLQ